MTDTKYLNELIKRGMLEKEYYYDVNILSKLILDLIIKYKTNENENENQEEKEKEHSNEG